MTLYIADVAGAMTHITAIQKEITSDVAALLGQEMNADEAFPYMRQASSVYPKWLSGLSTSKPELFGIFQEYDPFVVRSELQVGKITEGYDGALEQTLYTWIPYTLSRFRITPRLESATYPAPPTGLLESSIRLARPLMPGDVIAAEFEITLHFYIQNDERGY